MAIVPRANVSIAWKSSPWLQWTNAVEMKGPLEQYGGTWRGTNFDLQRVDFRPEIHSKERPRTTNPLFHCDRVLQPFQVADNPMSHKALFYAYSVHGQTNQNQQFSIHLSSPIINFQV